MVGKTKNLEWCSQAENIQHSYRTGLQQPSDKQKKIVSLLHRGEKNTNAKLCKNDIIKIRDMYKNGLTQEQISNKFPVSRVNISEIVNFKTWKHV